MIEKHSYVLMKLEPHIILKLFLNFRDFDPQYSCKRFSYKKERMPHKWHFSDKSAGISKTSTMTLQDSGMNKSQFKNGYKLVVNTSLYNLGELLGKQCDPAPPPPSIYRRACIALQVFTSQTTVCPEVKIWE